MHHSIPVIYFVFIFLQGFPSICKIIQQLGSAVCKESIWQMVWLQEVEANAFHLTGKECTQAVAAAQLSHATCARGMGQTPAPGSVCQP